MARTATGDRLEAAMKARAALDAEIKELQAAAKERKREEDERRMTLLGRVLDAHMAAEPGSKLTKDIGAMLDRKLTRPADRKLFNHLTNVSAKPAAAVEQVKSE